MFRTAALVLVAILAGAPGAALVCGSWCHAPGAVASECGHETPAGSRVAAGVRCDDAALDQAAYLKEESRRSSTNQDADTPAVLSSTAVTAGLHASPLCVHHPPDRRPLTLILRI